MDANLAAATPCVANVSILLNCATASALAGDEDEARRLESKAHGLGMKGDRWYQGWFDPAEIRLALARHELGGIPELAAHELDWDWEPASHLPGRTRRARRPRAHRGGGTQMAAARNVQRGIRAQGPRHRPGRSSAPPAGAGAIRGHGPLLARGADQAPAVKRDILINRHRPPQTARTPSHAITELKTTPELATWPKTIPGQRQGASGTAPTT